jgi:hypothetical protein
MSGLLTVNGQIKNPRSKIYRKLQIKRRLQMSGEYESEWVDISTDVIKWGNVRKEVDSTRVNQFKFSNVQLTLNNESGLYNPSSSDKSLWYGYGSQQRTLVRILASFVYEEKENGIWHRALVPWGGIWDEAAWDAEAYYDEETILYSGYISGDINLVGSNQINIPVVPLTECFRQFAARRLTGYNNSLTASDFMFMLRDQQDTSGNYIFRPFFGNTTSNWDISTTTVEYTNLNTSTAKDLTNFTTWDVISRLAEAENYIPFVTTDGKFKFFSRANSTSTVYNFYGPGYFSSEYGRQIKRINFFGERFSKYYSRVTVKYLEPDTSTSYAIKESDYQISGDSGPWTLGERTLNIENLWIPTATTAEAIAESLFDEFSSMKREIEFTTSFIPQLDVLDRVLISYDQSPISPQSLWDVYNWGGSTATADSFDLIFDDSVGDAIKLQDTEFRLISIDINLDSCECKFVGRE